MPDRFLNLSAYAFVALDRPPARRDALYQTALACGIKGTVLLAKESINLFVAGADPGAREWLARWRQEPPFAALDAKESGSPTLPDAPHWRGRSFVFDGRETLRAVLAPACKA